MKLKRKRQYPICQRLMTARVPAIQKPLRARLSFSWSDELVDDAPRIDFPRMSSFPAWCYSGYCELFSPSVATISPFDLAANVWNLWKLHQPISSNERPDLPRMRPAQTSAPARCLYLSVSRRRGSIMSNIPSRSYWTSIVTAIANLSNHLNQGI